MTERRQITTGAKVTALSLIQERTNPAGIPAGVIAQQW